MAARLGLLFAICFGAVLYVAGVSQMVHWRSSEGSEGLRVALPGYLNVLFAGGDRHLAANIAVFRSMMVGASDKNPLTYRIQGKLQRQAAVLNPYQEDNYYVAASILSWRGEVAAAQFVLDRATAARTWDWMPPFFDGFNAAYFNHDYRRAGHLAELAAGRASANNAILLRAIAAKWYSRQDQTGAAITTLAALREASHDRRYRRLLSARITQLKGLQTLKTAVKTYVGQHGSPPARLEDLVSAGLLTRLPADPLGQGYALDNDGEPVIRRKGHRQ